MSVNAFASRAGRGLGDAGNKETWSPGTGPPGDVGSSVYGTRNLVRACLDKRYTTFFFAQTGEIKDITGLDPAAVEDSEAGWGGLTEFSGKVAGIVSKVVARTEEQAPVEEGG